MLGLIVRLKLRTVVELTVGKLGAFVGLPVDSIVQLEVGLRLGSVVGILEGSAVALKLGAVLRITAGNAVGL